MIAATIEDIEAVLCELEGLEDSAFQNYKKYRGDPKLESFYSDMSSRITLKRVQMQAALDEAKGLED